EFRARRQAGVPRSGARYAARRGGALRRMRQRRSVIAPHHSRRPPDRAAAHAGAGPRPRRAVHRISAARFATIGGSRAMAGDPEPRTEGADRPDALQPARMKTVFFDIDSQLDFLYPAGALYVSGAERVVPTIARLNRYAAAHGIPVISTTDAHAEDDPEFRQWPPHCVAGTIGQHKAEATLLEKRLVVPNRDCALALDGAQQIVVEKQQVDALDRKSTRLNSSH